MTAQTHSPTRIAFELSSDRSPLPPLDGKRLVVHVVVNVESWPLDQPMPRKVLPPPHGREVVPDVPNYSWVEYGLRCGLPRLITLLDSRGIPASVSLNAAVIESHRRAAEAVSHAGWEFIGHGVTQRSLQAEVDELAAIEDCLSRIEEFSGTRPRGWLGPGLQETFNTPELLKEAGIEYVFDWIVDDLPVWLETRVGRLIALPYTLELNDSVIYAVEHQESRALEQRLADTLNTLDHELETSPRTLTLALHPHLVAAPHRIGYLARALDRLQDRSDVVFVTGRRMADWFTAAHADTPQ